MEIWKRIPNYSLYEASTYGRLKTFNWKGTGKEAIMKPALDGSGYYRTMLKRDDGVIHTIKVHRIIASTFLEQGDKTEVNHKNGIKTDNNLDNLEWVTRSENIKHSFRIGLNSNKGEGSPTAKLKNEQVLEIRAKYKPHVYTRKMLAKEYGVDHTCIKDIVNRRTWTHI